MLLITIVIFVSTMFGPADIATVSKADSYSYSSSEQAMISAPYPAGTCELAWFEASMIASDDIQDPAADLDIAIRTCKSLAAWMSEAAKYPELLYGRDAALVLKERCRDAAIVARICE